MFASAGSPLSWSGAVLFLRPLPLSPAGLQGTLPPCPVQSREHGARKWQLGGCKRQGPGGPLSDQRGCAHCSRPSGARVVLQTLMHQPQHQSWSHLLLPSPLPWPPTQRRPRPPNQGLASGSSALQGCCLCTPSILADSMHLTTSSSRDLPRDLTGLHNLPHGNCLRRPYLTPSCPATSPWPH